LAQRKEDSGKRKSGKDRHGAAGRFSVGPWSTQP
jgi:hypothetical protein